jgi:hypothetical protein
MFDVNVEAVIATLAGQRKVENIVPFMVPEKGVITLNMRADDPGFMELQVVSGAPVFLYRGKKTAKEVEALLLGEMPDFGLAAAIGQAAVAQAEPGMGMVTLFSEKNSLGFLRSCQYPK